MHKQDLDNDGDIDVVSPFYHGDTVRAYYNQMVETGSATFTTSTILPSNGFTADNAYDISLFDYNRDSYIDLGM